MKKIILAGCLCILSILLLLPGCSVNPTGAVASLRQQSESTDRAQLKEDLQRIYESNVAVSLIADKPNKILTEISDDEIRNASLSDPIPVFSSNEKYQKGEDYKSKLKLVGWDILVSSNGQPIAVFSVGELLGEWAYRGAEGQEYAILYADALQRLDSETAISLPLGSYTFFADATDTVVPMLTENEATGKIFPTRSFAEFNAAVNKSIDSYSEIKPEDLLIGGNVILMDALYGAENPLSWMRAGEILAVLQEGGFPIAEAVVYNAVTDPDGALGKEGSYTSRAGWIDTRGAQPTDGVIDLQVYQSEADCIAAYDELSGIYLAISSKRYILYQNSRVLLIVSGFLNDEQAAIYKDALDALAQGKSPKYMEP